MKALVTGATGFIGSAVLRRLLAEGVAVRALVRPNADRQNIRGLDIEVVEGDLSDKASLARACPAATPCSTSPPTIVYGRAVPMRFIRPMSKARALSEKPRRKLASNASSTRAASRRSIRPAMALLATRARGPSSRKSSATTSARNSWPRKSFGIRARRTGGRDRQSLCARRSA